MTIAELTRRYGRHWKISEGTAGGYYALRRHGLSESARHAGLSTVRAGATLTELATNLEEETRLTDRVFAPASLTWPVSR
jgi:hypothetical protein